MECPKCKGASKVLETRNDLKVVEAIRRRRQCTKCGYKFSTYELTETQYKYLVHVYSSFEGLSYRLFTQRQGEHLF